MHSPSLPFRRFSVLLPLYTVQATERAVRGLVCSARAVVTAIQALLVRRAARAQPTRPLSQ